jgi:arylsulfatase A-like enzyme
MNSDMRNVMFAEEVIKEFKPELLVVNMFGVDVAHTNFTKYCNALQYADWATAHLWDTIQNTPGMADDTLLVVMPEVGRNGTTNSIVDSNGRFALDHSSNDPTTREIFCMMAGPQGVINQNLEITSVTGRSVDVVPTIADALGFYNDVSGLLPGTPLTQAYV